MSTQNGLVQRLWSYCNVLRDDGLSYGDYLEQLTYLPLLKMADEQTRPSLLRARRAAPDRRAGRGAALGDRRAPRRD